MRTSKSKIISRWSHMADHLQLQKKHCATQKMPTGFIAVCQCNATTGAICYRRGASLGAPFQRATIEQRAKLMSEWLAYGYTIYPQFDEDFDLNVDNCTCANTEKKQ